MAEYPKVLYRDDDVLGARPSGKPGLFYVVAKDAAAASALLANGYRATLYADNGGAPVVPPVEAAPAVEAPTPPRKRSRKAAE